MKKIPVFLICCILLTGCDHFLDIKPDKSVAVPESIGDVRAILDYQTRINDNYPGLMDLAADDYFVDYTVWKSRSVADQGKYVWDGGEPGTQEIRSWSGSYGAIMTANVALEALEKLSNRSSDPLVEQLRGEALFIRAIRLYNLSQLFCMPYDSQGDNDAPGLVLRYSSDVNVDSDRSTISETYETIIKDLEKSLDLLPEKSQSITRPDITAAYALLAKVYLSMQDYETALSFADKALDRNNYLLDYNDLDVNSTIPFSLSNKEILYYAHNVEATTYITTARANVDTLLFSAFHTDDLRKELFFQRKANGYYAFKGHYTSNLQSLFTGLATDELYLIKSECLARNNDAEGALQTLNQLLEKRWKAGTFEEITGTDEVEILRLVLLERRKQLMFRGTRWGDLRRLNKDSRFRQTLTRRFHTSSGLEEYTLPHDDLRYVFLIPLNVIEITGMEQNRR